MIPKLIALDLDGTLLDSDGAVRPRTADVLEAAHQAGILVVVATGRPVGRAQEITGDLEFVTHTVAANGSVIFDRAGTTEYFALAREVADRTVATLRRALPGVGFQLITEADGGSEPGFEEFVKVLGDRTVADVAEVVGSRAVKLSVFHDRHGAEELLELLPPLMEPGVDVIHSGLDFVEVGPPGISKAAGLQVLCDRAGIDRGHTMAFGDGPNDHEMLAWAGVGVAMANAGEATRAFADRITASCDDDGIAEVIEPLVAQVRSAGSLPHVHLPPPVEPRGPARHHRAH